MNEDKQTEIYSIDRVDREERFAVTNLNNTHK